MRSFCCLFALSCLALSACQHSLSLSPEKKRPSAKPASLSQLKEAADLNLQLGMQYLMRNDFLRAKTKFLKALDLAPNAPEAIGALAFYFEKTGDLKEANKYYDKALSLAPHDGAQLNNYGAYLCRLGKYKESDMYFQQAVKDIHYLNTAKAYENAGLCAAELPDDAKAIEYFKKALEHDPERKQSLYELSSIKIRHNQHSEALLYFQKYQGLVFSDPLLLKQALKAAEKTGQQKLAALYRMHLSDSGEKNDHNNG